MEAGEQVTNVERPFLEISLFFTGVRTLYGTFLTVYTEAFFKPSTTSPLVPVSFSGSHFIFFLSFSFSRGLNRKAYIPVRILARFCPRCQQ